MSLSDYLSVPFLISLGITLLLVGIVGMFFTQRLQEQNHKINSMVGLVSAMAEEVNFIRNRVGQIDGNGGGASNITGGKINVSNVSQDFKQQNTLIEVSDGEYSDDDDSESDSESESDADDENDSDEEDAENFDEISSNIKVINIHENNVNENFEATIEELNDSDSDSDNESSDSKSESSESVNLVEVDSNTDLDTLNFSLSNVNDKHLKVDLDAVDYKKFSLNKLRSIVSEKGLVDDANKLKKPELLKLLGL
jgi:hypothetical protein